MMMNKLCLDSGLDFGTSEMLSSGPVSLGFRQVNCAVVDFE